MLEKNTLQNVFHFTDADWQANRKGLIGKAQEERAATHYLQYKPRMNCAVVIGMFLMLIALAMLYFIFYIDYPNDETMATMSIIVLTLVLVLSSGWVLLALKGKVAQNHLKNRIVSEASGYVKKKVSTFNPKNSAAQRIYMVEVGDANLFMPSKEAFEAIEEDKRYHFYYIKHFPQLILSVNVL